MADPAHYGGQAVLEGVMIRGPRAMAVACRRPNGTIAVRSQVLTPGQGRWPRTAPVVRGVAALSDTLTLGLRALKFSSTMATADSTGDEAMPDRVFWGAMAVALGFVGVVFFATPALLAAGVATLGLAGWAAALIEGVVRMAMLAAYIGGVSLLPGVRRIFQYHGAEHMVIHAAEAGARLQINGVRPFPKEHRRCGTSFLFIVVLASLVTFFLFDLAVRPDLVERLLSRLALIPLVAGLAYEVLRLGARAGNGWLARLLFLPNIALQAITTRTPEDAQIAVALASYEAAVACAAQAPESAQVAAMAAPATAEPEFAGAGD